MKRKQKFREQCSCCNKWTDDYITSTGKILCKKCMESQNQSHVENKVVDEKINGRSQKPIKTDIKTEQLDIGYFLYGYHSKVKKR